MSLNLSTTQFALQKCSHMQAIRPFWKLACLWYKKKAHLFHIIINYNLVGNVNFANVCFHKPRISFLSA